MVIVERKIDPRSQSSKWRCARTIRMYKRGELRLVETVNLLVHEGLSEPYVGKLLSLIRLEMDLQRERRNERRRARYAERKAAEKAARS